MTYSVFCKDSNCYKVYKGPPNVISRSSIGAYRTYSALGASPEEVQNFLPVGAKQIGESETPKGQIVVSTQPSFMSFLLSVMAILTANWIFNTYLKKR